MFGFLRRRRSPARPVNWFAKQSRATAAPDAAGLRTMRARRWESADTDRLNEAHWQKVTHDQSINSDLAAHLTTLRSRTLYESANNAFVDGVITTHANDIVGPAGPTLRVLSDDDAYNAALEAVVSDWFRSPCISGKMGIAALLRLWINSLWHGGEFLAQKVTDTTVPANEIRLRLKPIASRRLATPPRLAGQANIVMGVEINPTSSRVLRYHVAAARMQGGFEILSGESDTLPAADVIHEFLIREEDQLRGVPWLSSSLQPIADLRDYDEQVLDAARTAADSSVLLHTDHPDSTYVSVNESVEFERRTISTAPPGWKPSQMVPTQPAAQYNEYRRERQAEIGRGVCMPLMLIRLDSARHNYSSARFDGQVYQRALQCLQYWISGTPQNRGVLGDLVDDIAREGELIRGLLPPRPARVRYEWLWPQPPHVDPKKEAEAERIQLEDGTRLLADAIAPLGREVDDHLGALAAEIAAARAAGVQHPCGRVTTPAPDDPPEPPAGDVDAGDDDTAAAETLEETANV